MVLMTSLTTKVVTNVPIRLMSSFVLLLFLTMTLLLIRLSLLVSHIKRGRHSTGENGALYRSALNVTDDKSSGAGGVDGQKYSEYKDGKVLYYAIINPDVPEKPLNAPVYRNNIYHISVKGFKKIGVNWNPLFPEDPNTPDPKKNPDPKPNNPNEPVPPIKPEDNLSPKETYMSVDVSVIPWNVHTY